MEKELNIPEGTEVTEPLKIYLNEIGQIPLLDAEEEKELGRRSVDGDEEARRRLEEGNLRLVVSIAKHYTGRGATPENKPSPHKGSTVQITIGSSSATPSTSFRYATWNSTIA